jgi:large subunit ribosomal protein L3
VFGVRAYAKTPYGMKTVSEVFAEKPDKDLSRVICLPKKSSREEKVKRINAALGSIAEFRLLVHTQPRKIRFKKTPELLEFTVSGKPEEAWKWALDILGKEIAFKSVFAENDWVDAIAITTGKGTQGPVARFGIKIQGRKAHGHRRFPGCIGGWHPAKTLWTVPQMGQVGFQRRTDLNKRLLKIGEDGKEVTPDGGFVNYGQAVGSYALVQGSVPGPRNRLVVLRHALRQNRKLPALAIVETIRSTQQ